MVVREEACPACGSVLLNRAIQRYRDPILQQSYALNGCPACDLEFWTPLVMPDRAYYEQAVGEYEHYHAGDDPVLRWWHSAVLQMLPAGPERGRILDVGCADGRFLRAMQDRGWTVAGIDFDRRSVDAARRLCPGAEIVCGAIEDVAGLFGPDSFDIVTFFEVLEHQPAPVSFLTTIQRLLKPGGLVGGSVPNRRRYLTRTRYSPDIPPHHFTLWTADALRQFLQSRDFEDVRMRFVRYEPILVEQIIRHAFARPIAAVKNRLHVRSFETADYGGRPTTLRRALTLMKRGLWNPAMKVLTLPEYPVLWASGRGISLCFVARLGGNPSARD